MIKKCNRKNNAKCKELLNLKKKENNRKNINVRWNWKKKKN